GVPEIVTAGALQLESALNEHAVTVQVLIPVRVAMTVAPWSIRCGATESSLVRPDLQAWSGCASEGWPMLCDLLFSRHRPISSRATVVRAALRAAAPGRLGAWAGGGAGLDICDRCH